MANAPHVDVDPFAATVRSFGRSDPRRAALRAAGPLVRVDAPAGGWAWIVTDDALAREVLADPRIAKDPAFAPPGWDQQTGALEPTAAVQPSLTTLDGPAHAELRRAHTPLFTARRMGEYSPRITAIARELLTELAAGGGTVDVMADFTTRFSLTVLLDLLGAPLDRIDQAADACRRMFSDDPQENGMAMAAFMELAAAAFGDGTQGVAASCASGSPTTPPPMTCTTSCSR